MTFQTSVNVYNALGIVGDIAFADGGERLIAANLYSAGVPNYFGHAYTFTSAATSATSEPSGAAPNGASVTVGGSGLFAGILCGTKQNALRGTTSSPLAASLALPDYEVGQLMQRGYVFASLPGPADPGDLVTYDPLTGALNSIAPVTNFTAAIAPGGASTADVMTVSAVASGALAIGQVISGAGIPTGTYIASLGTGLGYTGTYNLSTINTLTVSSEAMTAPNVPVPAFTGQASFATNVMTVGTATTGSWRIGDQVFATGLPANTVITAFGTGVGGTGTYTLNQTVGTLNSRAITGPVNALVPNAVVERYQADSTGGVAVIKLSN